MSVAKTLGHLFLAVFLGAASMFGARIDPRQIEELMNVMHRTKVEFVVKQDDD
jgi:hypothetical protein